MASGGGVDGGEAVVKLIGTDSCRPPARHHPIQGNPNGFEMTTNSGIHPQTYAG